MDPQLTIGCFVSELAGGDYAGLYWPRHLIDLRPVEGLVPLTPKCLYYPDAVLRLDRERVVAGMRRLLAGYQRQSDVLWTMVRGDLRGPQLEMLRSDANQFGLAARRAEAGLARIFAAPNAPWFRFLEEMGGATRQIDSLVSLAKIDFLNAAHGSLPLGALYLNEELRFLALTAAGAAPVDSQAYRAYVAARAAAGDRLLTGIRQYSSRSDFPFCGIQQLVPLLREKGNRGGMGSEMLQAVLRTYQGDLQRVGEIVWSRPNERRNALVLAGGREVQAEKRLVAGALGMFDRSLGHMFPAAEALRVAKGQSVRAHAARLAVASCGTRGGGPAYAMLVQKLAGLGALGLLIYFGCSSESGV